MTILKFIQKKGWLGLVVLLQLFAQDVWAQCNPNFSGSPCVDAAIEFKANSPGFTSWSWNFGDGTGTSTSRDPVYSYKSDGTYQVTYSATGPAGSCSKTLTVVVKPAPTINVQRSSFRDQCFEGNEFCFVDSSAPVQGSRIVRATYVFSDGGFIEEIDPTFPRKFCYNVKDPRGGQFDLAIEMEDSNGCISRKVLKAVMNVWPRLGVSIKSNAPTGCDSTLATITNLTYQNWLNEPDKYIGLKDIASFEFNLGDTTVIIGDSVTNTDWWTGKNGDGIIKYWYRMNGTFDATLRVVSRFGCTETFTYKAAATNIKIKPVILADKDSSCVGEPEVTFRLKDGPIPGARFLWNFGDPPAGPLNFDDKSWTPTKSYGSGPWMVSLRIIVGPCDIMTYDTVLKIGPASTIEVPFVRVLEKEKYQCVIKDSVHFTNNSVFYHDDPNMYDEDSFKLVTALDTTGFYYVTRRLPDNSYCRVDTLAYTNVRQWKEYAFNFKVPPPMPGTGDQTTLSSNAHKAKRHNEWILRIWTLGDNYAPKCTTDTRANKNVGRNCNYTLDTLPVHWYTPWEEIYKEYRDGQNYKQPVRRTLFSKNARRCFQVNVYAADTIIIPADTLVIVPWDSTFTFAGHTIDSGKAYPEKVYNPDMSTFRVKRPRTFYASRRDAYREIVPKPVYDTISFLEKPRWLKCDNPNDSLKVIDTVWTIKTTYKYDTFNIVKHVPLTWTVTFDDEQFWVPAGVKFGVNNVETGATRTVTGPKMEVVKKWEQFTLNLGDTIYSRTKVNIRPVDITYAAPSIILKDTSYTYWDGVQLVTVDTFVQYSAKVVDAEFHRDWFYNNVAQCNSVTLWQKDTVHPMQCESSNNISLALIPPNARGLKWESGIPCPLDGDKLQYYLTFDMAETKPGCTQQWFEVNYDSLTGPNDWVAYNSGGVLAPPPPGNPIPFIMPYMIVGAWGTKFVKGYTPLEVGQDPKKRPKGSFTIGLAVGNGPPNNGKPPMCMDTAWYSDMFRILYVNADFEILIPEADPRFLCAGETAYFRILNPIQDSISALRWNWGYQDRTMGYFEQWKYYEPYPGPSPTRNDKDVQWKGEKWLYNYVIRSTIDDVRGVVVVDTIVRSIMRDWQIITNTDRADQIIKDAFKALGLDLRDIPKQDVALYLGDGTFGCIDTTGLSEYFSFGIRGYDDSVTVKHGRYKYLFKNKQRTDSVIIEEILHFRDSSIQGFDTLFKKNGNKIDTITGVYKFEYKHPVVVPDPCGDPSKNKIEWVKSSGPMGPNLFLNNTVGCEKRGSKLLNVGFLNWFKMAEDAVCKGTAVLLRDSIRYWQLGDADIEYYPIDRNKYWEDPTRYINNIETKEVDWDAKDGLDDYERSVVFTHVYDEPGEYLIHIAMKDSLGCRDTASIRTYVTGVKAGFEHSNSTDQCKQIVSFFDTTVVYDPCKLKDTCPNAPYNPCDYITEWLWDFGDSTQTSVLQNPSHNYTSSGWKVVKLWVKTLLGCESYIEDSIFIIGPQPAFELLNSPWGPDSIIICVNDSISLENKSREPYWNPDWIFSWGDSSLNNTTSTRNIMDTVGHRYRTPGVYYLQLTMVDSITGTALRCSRVFPDNSPDILKPRKIKVIVLPRAPADFIMSDSVVCPEEEITFTDKSDPLYTRYTWYYGDGDTLAGGPIVTHSYKNSGNYTVTLVPDYDPIGFVPKCVDTARKNVTVIDVTAAFTIDSTNKPEFCFKNESVNAVKYTWIIEDRPFADRITDETNPCHTWGERVGTYEVCLIAESAEGCLDTVCELVNNQFFLQIIPYNVFTPGKGGGEAGNGKNDKFFIKVKGADEYEIKIFNRWGELVYESDDPEQGWDGTIMNKGTKLCPEGAYFYIINYKMRNREENDGKGPISGTVTLIRE